MSVSLSKRLSNSLEGALAGGGDPATSPLYVFGPFLQLIVVAGVANVTFGASIWMAVFSVIVVSAMYRQVMFWITDGSGGSGLSEEEFGSWAVKITAGITVIEYVLTYLVSMAALVTFIADRLPLLNKSFHGIEFRAVIAIALTGFACWLVNLGPKVSARAFGPATAAVLLLLWAMILATIATMGFHLPDFNLQAFSLDTVYFTSAASVASESSYLNLTFGGFARILALMTGIEIFANLVAAYDGTRAERSKKAFGSLVIIMGTTVITMLIVGPAILNHSDPMNESVSVFTQTMDFLFPPWLSYAGTLIGIVVLLSACAAAAQAIQNLALGLRYRHYIAAKMGQRNKHDVADIPVWIMAGFCSFCFLAFGTSEETYLALYAAGVFILLSMTGWAATKRLIRELKETYSTIKLLVLSGTIISALLTTFATLVIFEERFYEGAWTYVLMVPVLYLVFNYYRYHLGPPPSVEDRLGRIVSGQGFAPQATTVATEKKGTFNKALIALDGVTLSDQMLPMVRFLCPAATAEVDLLVISNDLSRSKVEWTNYARNLSETFANAGFHTEFKVAQGEAAAVIDRRSISTRADIIFMTTIGNAVSKKTISNGMVEEVIRRTLTPMIVIHPDNVQNPFRKFSRILVALDGSESSESVLPYIRTMVRDSDVQVCLLTVPEGSESEQYSHTIQIYMENIAKKLKSDGINATVSVTGSGPARTILAMVDEFKADLIMMASHGRGGIDRPTIHLGSVTEKVLEHIPCPMFIVPLTKASILGN